MARLITLNLPEKIIKELDIERVSIGRLPENDLPLNDVLVSRTHAEVRREGGRFRIVDLHSLNGIYVNNLRVSDEYLSSGDVITIGNIQLLFEDTLPGGQRPAELAVSAADQGYPSGEIPFLGEEFIKPLPAIENELGLDYRGPVESAAYLSLKAPPDQKFFVLYQIARALNSTNSFNELLDLALSLAFQVISAERGVILLLNDENELVPRASRSRGPRSQEPISIPVSQTISRRAIEEKAGIITSDAKYDPRFKSGQSIMEYNIRSALCVPIHERDTVRGVIYLDNLLKSYAFKEDDLNLLTAIANQIALALRQEEMQNSIREQAIFRANLERFHSPDVVNHVIKQSRDKKKLEQQVTEREVTILFTDICGFTRLSERLAAQDVANLLFEYFSQMSKIVFKYKGTVDKFIGDAIMAIFGAPISYGNDAELACYAAIEIMNHMKEFNRNIDERKRFNIRIGINTGMVVAGYLGSSLRMEYSVLGDAVNVAARLQDIAPPGTIIVGEATYEKVQGAFSMQSLGSTRLKGKQKELKVYEVISGDKSVKDSLEVPH
jgi:adenylate cyclase